MPNLNVVYRDQDYPLATTLRVAYKIQGQNDHKPYAEVFKSVGDMPVEKQIDIIYAAAVCGTEAFAKNVNAKDFREDYLDRYNLKDLMKHLEAVIKGIMGEDEDAPVSEDSGEDAVVEGN